MILETKLSTLDNVEFDFHDNNFKFNYHSDLGSITLDNDFYSIGCTPFWEQKRNDIIPLYVYDLTRKEIIYERKILFKCNPNDERFIQSFLECMNEEMNKFLSYIIRERLGLFN